MSDSNISNICQRLINRLIEDDSEEENDQMLQKIKKVQRDIEREDLTAREIDLGTEEDNKKAYFDRTMSFCKESENDLSIVEGFKVHQAIVFVHEDIRRIENLFETLGQTFAKVFHFTMPDNEEGDKPNIFWLCTIGNKTKHMMTIKQIKFKFKECHCLWGNLEVFGTTSSSADIKNFLKYVGWKVTIIVDGERIVDEEFNFFSAQEFCFKHDIRDPHQLMRLYTSLKTGSPTKHHTNIAEGILLGKQANARAIFKFANPIMQMKAVIEGAESRRIGEFRITPRISYLMSFLEMHSVCCLSPFLSDKPDCIMAKKTAIWEWLNYMEIDPLMFGLNLTTFMLLPLTLTAFIPPLSLHPIIH